MEELLPTRGQRGVLEFETTLQLAYFEELPQPLVGGHRLVQLLTSEHLIEDIPRTKHITLLCVLPLNFLVLVRQVDFRGRVGRSALAEGHLHSVDVPRSAEVSYFELPLLRDEQVVRLQVTVKDI